MRFCSMKSSSGVLFLIVLMSFLQNSCGAPSKTSSVEHAVVSQSISEKVLDCKEVTTGHEEPQIFAIVQKSATECHWDATVSSPDKTVFFTECPGAFDELQCKSGTEGPGKRYLFKTYRSKTTSGIFADYVVIDEEAPPSSRETQYSLSCRKVRRTPSK